MPNGRYAPLLIRLLPFVQKSIRLEANPSRTVSQSRQLERYRVFSVGKWYDWIHSQSLVDHGVEIYSRPSNPFQGDLVVLAIGQSGDLRVEPLLSLWVRGHLVDSERQAQQNGRGLEASEKEGKRAVMSPTLRFLLFLLSVISPNKVRPDDAFLLTRSNIQAPGS